MQTSAIFYSGKFNADVQVMYLCCMKAVANKDTLLLMTFSWPSKWGNTFLCLGQKFCVHHNVSTTLCPSLPPPNVHQWLTDFFQNVDLLIGYWSEKLSTTEDLQCRTQFKKGGTFIIISLLLHFFVGKKGTLHCTCTCKSNYQLQVSILTVICFRRR